MATATAPVLSKTANETLPNNHFLLAGGWFSLLFALFQFSGIWWPASGIRYFGGPAKLSIERPVVYASLCIGVVIIAALFGIYALAGAGKIRRMPLLRTVLVFVTTIYLLRGLLFIPQVGLVLQHPQYLRFLMFSVISLVVGVVHFIGVVKLFRHLRVPTSETDR